MDKKDGYFKFDPQYNEASIELMKLYSSAELDEMSHYELKEELERIEKELKDKKS